MSLALLFSSLGGVLINASRGMVMQVLIALGVSVVTYQGVDSAITWAKSQALSSFQGLPADMVALLSYMGVGVSINIIFSAMVMRMTLQGISGVHKRFRKT
jgi:hypothetical protein